MPHLTNVDKTLLRVIKQQPELRLWDHYGYPLKPTVESLAIELEEDELDIYTALKYLKNIEAFAPGFDPRKPIKSEGFFEIRERLTNQNAESIDIPPIRKTAAKSIVDDGIRKHCELIPEPEYESKICPQGGHEVLIGKPRHFTKQEVLSIVAPLVQAMRTLAPMFPSVDERTKWCNKVAATTQYIDKVVHSHQTDFDYVQLNTVATGVIRGLHEVEKNLDRHLPELPPDKDTLQKSSPGLRIIKSSQVEPELIEWLWKDRIPLGKLTLFSGNPDVGKSLVSLDVAARLSSGRDFPDGAKNAEESDILILAAEDDPADTIVPRLMAAGANLDRVHLLTGTSADDYERSFALDSDVQLLKDHLADNPDIRLVIIDPISNYLGAAEINKEQELRRVLTPLVNISRDANCAVLTIAHFNKQISADAIHKTGGAVGLVGIQRMAWAFTKSPDDPDLRLMLRIKGNLSANCKGLSYRTTSKTLVIQGQQATLPVVEWAGATSETADGVLAAAANPEEKSARQVAVWLREFLPIRSTGKKLAREVFQLAEAKGFSDATVRRAAQQLNVEKWQEAGATGQNCWYWAVPGDDKLF